VNINQIYSSLEEIFNEPLQDGEKRKIVFWTDLDGDFINDYENIQLDKVKIIHLHEDNQFFVKHLLEEEGTTSHYLIYTNLDLTAKDNWLYDTVLYSETFFADRISLILQTYHIQPSLRPVVQKYITYFDNKDRRRRLQSFGIQSFNNKETLELAMMNAICKTRALDFETVLRTVLMDTLDDDNNRYLYDLKRFFNIETFWHYVEKEYDYKRDKPTLKTLFIHLAVTAFSQTIEEKYLADFTHFIAEGQKTNAFVFIDHWMHHKTDYTVFNEYILAIEKELQIKDLIHSLTIDAFKEADVFPYIDRAIIIYIANSLIDQQEDYETYIDLINGRRAKHFYERYEHTYQALFYTVKMYEFQKRYRYGIPQGQAIDIYQAYVDEYYAMDYYYRKFYVAYDQAEHNDLFMKLKQLVENLYTNWFMGELSSHWSQSFNETMTEKWTLPGVYNQQNFFSNVVRNHIDDNERVFVIISDALRYEVGVELQEKIDREIIGSCKIDTMLGVVPSVTKLGMAALLPHKQIQLNDSGDVFVNGMRSSSLDHRHRILNEYMEESIAIHYEKMLDMNTSQRRDTFRGKKLIYIYHDTIDATGDKASSEHNTFLAAESALDQISQLVRIIRNDLSGTYVYVTADHGFIYQRDPLETTDLMVKEDLDSVEISRRYMLSYEQKAVSGQQCINVTGFIDSESPLFAYVPNATIRYRIQGGGANFVHGGASLQEVVVPLLTIRNKRTGQSGAKEITQVDISLTSTTRRITNSIFTLDFFQMEKVGEKSKPRTVVAFMADEENNILSNEETIIGDLTSEDPRERTFTIQFVLKNMSYDRNKTYYLVVKDVETDVIVEKIPFTINLSIISDFDF